MNLEAIVREYLEASLAAEAATLRQGKASAAVHKMMERLGKDCIQVGPYVARKRYGYDYCYEVDRPEVVTQLQG